MYSGYEYNQGGFAAGGGGSMPWFTPMAGGGGGSDMMGGGGGMGGFLDGGSKSAEKKTKDKQSVTPVSIKQLNTLSNEGDSVYVLDGKEVFTVKIIGLIVDIELHSTNINMKINDGTGTFSCKLWLEKDAADNKYDYLRKNDMVRIFGSVREFTNDGYASRYIQVFNCSPVVDFNEVTYHLLDVIYVHLQRTKGPLPQAGSMSSASSARSHNSPSVANQNHSSFGFQMNSTSVPASARNPDELKTAVCDVIRSLARPDGGGSHIEDIKRVISTRGINVGKPLLTFLSELSAEGTIYSGTDDFHYIVNL